MMMFEQIALHTFCHTAEHTDNQRAFAAHGMQGFETVINLLLGIVADGTGIEKYGISLVKAVDGLVACHFHHAGHNLGIGHIHLAAVGFDIEFLHIWFPALR